MKNERSRSRLLNVRALQTDTQTHRELRLNALWHHTAVVGCDNWHQREREALLTYLLTYYSEKEFAFRLAHRKTRRFLCNCNWGTCIASPPRRPRAHHRVNPYPLMRCTRHWSA